MNIEDSAMKGEQPIIGVDFDGTLAYYDGNYKPGVVGKPIPAMLRKVQELIFSGKKVVIFTARASGRNSEIDVPAIKKWCRKHIGADLEVTAIKDFRMVEFYDDRAIGIVCNEGRRKDGNPL